MAYFGGQLKRITVMSTDTSCVFALIQDNINQHNEELHQRVWILDIYAFKKRPFSR